MSDKAKVLELVQVDLSIPIEGGAAVGSRVTVEIEGTLLEDGTLAGLELGTRVGAAKARAQGKASAKSSEEE